MNWIYNEHHRISKRFGIALLILLQVMLLVLPPDVAAYVGQSSNYKITSSNISEGGNRRTSSMHRLSQDTIGGFVGKSNSQNYKLASGFVHTSTTYNHEPVLDYVGNKSVNEDELLQFTITASDEDGNALSFSISNRPNNAIFTDNGDNTATFSWTPTYDDSGTYPGVRFDVTDGRLTDSETITITVGDINRPPELVEIGNKSVNENELLEFIITADDPDGDNLSFNASNLPQGAGLTNNGDNTATFSWTPTYEQSGSYLTVNIEVSDTELNDDETILIAVDNVNRPPYFVSPIPNIEVDEGGVAVINPAPYVDDPDGETLHFYYEEPFNEEGTWITGYDDAGMQTVTVTISDMINTITQDVQVVVNNVNRAPQAELTLSTYTVNKGEVFDIFLTVSDLDGDTLTFTIEKDDAQIASGSIVDEYSMTTSIAVIGDHTISATVTDSGGLTAQDSEGVDVIDPNQSRSDFYPVLGDFNGDGVTDIGLHNNSSGVWEIAISDDGNFTSAPDWLSGFGDSKDWLTLGGDFDGDGYNDIGIYNNTTGECRIAFSNGSSFDIQQDEWLTFADASYDWQPLTGDFNGDGKTDFGLYNKKSGTLKVAASDGSSFGILDEKIPSFGGNDEVALAGDFNGDALPDIVIYNESSGDWSVAFNVGSGFQDQGVWKPGYAAGEKILVTDFNSDGLVDIGYFEKDEGRWHYAISNGTSFGNDRVYHEGFGSSGVETGHTGDFDGNGIIDLATFDQDKDGIERWDIHLKTANFSDLLVRADNGIGGVTTIAYDYASKQDNDILPFPVYVVTSVTVTDSEPDGETPENYTQNFSYRGGYYSAEDREFRGFYMTTVRDPITGNYTETYFHQGKDGEEGALKGQIDKIIAYDGNDKEISEVLNSYEVVKGGPLDNNLGFPYVEEVHTVVYEENLSYVETIDRFQYNNIGNVTRTINEGDITTDEDNKTTRTVYAQAYGEFNRILQSQLSDKDDNVLSQKTFEYDEKGNLERQIDYFNAGDDPVTCFEYDSYGNVTSTINANEHRVTTMYESIFSQFPETIMNELGHTINYTYEPKFGLVKTIQDANGNTTTTNYDTLGRMTEEINTYNQIVTSYTYPDFNTKITTQLNLTKTEYVDGLGRNYKTKTIGEDGVLAKEVITEKFFNERGLLEAESLPHYTDASGNEKAYVRYSYDIRGRVRQVTADFPGTLKDANTITQYITPLSTKVIDPKGHAKTTIKDVNGSVVEVIEHTSDGDFHTYYKYDLRSNLVRVTDDQGNITQIFYDTLGRKTSMIDPDTGTTEYTYDAMGNILTQKDNKQQVITFIYDDINRLERKEYDSPTMSDVVYTYDALDPPNSTGRLSSVYNGASETFYEYDKEGRVVEVTKIIDGETYITQTSYDILGRIESITYPDNEEVIYTYDSNSGLLEKVEGSQAYIEDITYNAQGQIRTIIYGNNTQTTYTYGQDQRLQRVLTQNQTEYLQDLNYDFDKAGNLFTLTDNLRSNIRTYQYDDLNRLKRAENIPDPLGGYSTYTYQYDPIGNMTYKSDVGSYVYGEGNAGPHAVTTAGSYSYFYDENGNMVSGRGKDFTYDDENRLIEVNNLNQITTFEYNHNGSRIKKVTSEQTVTYIGKLYEVITDGVDTTKTVKHIYTGSDRSITVELDTQTTQTATSYYHTDHLGSSNVITDENGDLQSHFEYLPYGKTSRDERPINSDSRTNDYRFTGKELDTSGLYYYGARYYDPEIGRFITADSIVQNPLDPQTLNRYTYCRNNPLIYTDPTGHSWFSKWIGKIVGAIVGITVGIVTGNPVLGFQAYAAISSTYDTGYALAHGADPLRTVGAFFAANIMAAILPGGGTYDNLFVQVAVHAARGAVIGATTAAISGGDIGQGAMLGGAIGGAIGFASSNQSQNWLHGKGFVSNADLAKIQRLKVTGNLERTARVERYALSPSKGNTENKNQQYRIVKSSSVKIEKKLFMPLSDYLGFGPDCESNSILTTYETVYRTIPADWVYKGENVQTIVDTKWYIFLEEFTRIEFTQMEYGPQE